MKILYFLSKSPMVIGLLSFLYFIYFFVLF
nr:MAG TPA: hypothetical protein [Bacteriophage sp.]